jgi:hypothetical protein
MPTPIKFVGLDRGSNPVRPPRTLQSSGEGEVWRNSNNIRFRDGYCGPRPRLKDVDDVGYLQGFHDYPGSSTWPTIENDATGGNEEGNAQIPLFIFTEYDQGPAFEDVFANSHSVRQIIVTTREIHRFDNTNGWVNLTPTYTLGRVNTSGTTITIGSGGTGTPLWSTHSISVGCLIKVGTHAWTRIVTVSDTTITVADSQATVSNTAYIIRRCWTQFGLDEIHWSQPLHAAIFNGDLFVAGPLLKSEEIALVRVVECWSGASPTTSYLVSSVDPTGSTPVFINLGTTPVIAGIDVLNTGAACVGVSDEKNTAQIHFSDVLDITNWATGTSGVQYLTTHRSPLRAIFPSETGITAHFDDGIAPGDLTGRPSPPLRFHTSRATEGAISARAIHRVSGGHLAYLARDNNVYLFDGTLSTPMSNSIRHELGRWRLMDLANRAHFSWNRRDRELSLWVPQSSRGRQVGGNSYETREYTWSEQSGSWATSTWPVWIGSVTDWMDGAKGVPDGRAGFGIALVGTPTREPVHNTATAYQLQMKLVDAGTVEDTGGSGDAAYWGGSQTVDAWDGGTFVESDDYEGEPGSLLSATRVSLVANSLYTRDEIVRVLVSYDSGRTWLLDRQTLALAAYEDRRFDFNGVGHSSGEKCRVRIEWPADSTFFLGSLSVEISDAGNERASPPFRIESKSPLLLVNPFDLPGNDGDGIREFERLGDTDVTINGAGNATAALNIAGNLYRSLVCSGSSDTWSLSANQAVTGAFTLVVGLETTVSAQYTVLGGSAAKIELHQVSDQVNVVNDSSGSTNCIAPSKIPAVDTAYVLTVIRKADNALICRLNGVDVTASGSPSRSGTLTLTTAFKRAAGTTQQAGLFFIKSDLSADTELELIEKEIGKRSGVSW